MIALAAVVLLFGSGKECVPFTEALKHVDENVCVTGTVLKVDENGHTGTQLLRFCEAGPSCPFTAVVLASDMEQVGDLKQLVGKEVRLYGRIGKYDHQAEMVVTDARQFKGYVVSLPPPPQQFDAETQGHSSPGNPRPVKSNRSHRKKKARPEIPDEIPQ